MQNDLLRLRINPQEKQIYTKAASSLGLSLSGFVKAALRRAAGLEVGQLVPKRHQIKIELLGRGLTDHEAKLKYGQSVYPSLRKLRTEGYSITSTGIPKRYFAKRR